MARSTGLVLLADQARHDTGAHPENSRRIPPVVERLKASEEWSGFRLVEARSADVEDILRAHSPAQVEMVRTAAESGPTWIDGDTPVSPASYEIALKAAGAAMAAVDEVVAEGPESPDSLFALIRPPGHHATPDRAMGFCLFNNAAVAARYAAERYGFGRVAVLDWDVHHGNGTQDVLWRDPSALFISLHQWPLYPGTGWIDEVGAGDGEGFTVNLPLPPGSGDPEYTEAFDRVVEPVLEAYDPQLLIVSAGQDAHAADQLAGQMISTRGYNLMATRSAEFAAAKGIGMVALHEGGYNLDTLPQLDHAIVAGFGGFEADLSDPFEGVAGPAAEWPGRLEDILAVQRKYWPGVG